MFQRMMQLFKDGEQTRAGFFVDPDQCLDHGCCIEDAPSVFRLPKAGVGSEVYRQPSTDDEINTAVRAMEYCPLDAICYGGKDSQIISKIKVSDIPDECIIHD